MFGATTPKDVLLQAAKAGDLEKVKLCLEQCVNIKARSYGIDDGTGEALLYASMFGHDEIVRFLLEQGANLTLRDDARSWMPVIHAAANNNKGIVMLLLQANAGLVYMFSDRRDAYATIIRCLNSEQLNGKPLDSIKILYPHPNQAGVWITTEAELAKLPLKDKLAIADKWPTDFATSVMYLSPFAWEQPYFTSDNIRKLTSFALLERRKMRFGAELMVALEQLGKLLAEKSEETQQTWNKLPSQEQTNYKHMLIGFNNYKQVNIEIQTKIFMEMTGNQACAQDDINEAIDKARIRTTRLENKLHP